MSDSPPPHGPPIGSLLARTAEMGTVLAAYIYFLGWQFFGAALAPFHVSPEQVGITPAWLLVRSVPVALLIASIAVAGFGLGMSLVRREAGTRTLLRVVWSLMKFLLWVIVIVAIYIGVSWAIHAVAGPLLPGPNWPWVQRLRASKGDLAILWFALIASLTVLGITISTILLLLLDARVLSLIRPRASNETTVNRENAHLALDSDSEKQVHTVSRATDNQTEELSVVERAFAYLKTFDPRTSRLALIVCIAFLTLFARGVSNAAGTELGSYVLKGNPVIYGKMISWPTARVGMVAGAGNAPEECVILLGKADGVFVVYSPTRRQVDYKDLENATIIVPLSPCQPLS